MTGVEIKAMFNPFSPFSQKLASYDDQHGSRILAELTLKAWLASHSLIQCSLLAEQPEILISLFANATSNEQYAVSKLTPKDIGFEPNSWEQAMSCVEKDKWLSDVQTKSKKKPLTLRWVFKVKHDGTYKHGLLLVAFVKSKI
ncbi:hypothetical protein PDIDSM_3458 [Penicillium digitatum]|nr:hypothetical protein PDIDSM_3458 [Penicillium digitatum]